VFTKHKRHQVQATTEGNCRKKKDNQKDYLIFRARRHLTEIQIRVRLLQAHKATAYISSRSQRRWCISTWLMTTLMEYDTASTGNQLQTFRKNMLPLSSWRSDRCSEVLRNVGIYQSVFTSNLLYLR
jgi:hypothetical protein